MDRPDWLLSGRWRRPRRRRHPPAPLQTARASPASPAANLCSERGGRGPRSAGRPRPGRDCGGLCWRRSVLQEAPRAREPPKPGGAPPSRSAALPRLAAAELPHARLPGWAAASLGPSAAVGPACLEPDRYTCLPAGHPARRRPRSGKSRAQEDAAAAPRPRPPAAPRDRKPAQPGALSGSPVLRGPCH